MPVQQRIRREAEPPARRKRDDTSAALGTSRPHYDDRTPGYRVASAKIRPTACSRITRSASSRPSAFSLRAGERRVARVERDVALERAVRRREPLRSPARAPRRCSARAWRDQLVDARTAARRSGRPTRRAARPRRAARGRCARLAHVAREHHDHADRALALVAQRVHRRERARRDRAAPIASVSSNTERSRVSATSSSTSSLVTARSPAYSAELLDRQRQPRQVVADRVDQPLRPPAPSMSTPRAFASPRTHGASWRGASSTCSQPFLPSCRVQLQPLVELASSRDEHGRSGSA